MSPRNANIIACGVIIIFAIFIGLGSRGAIKSPAYKSVVLSVVFGVAGGFILCVVFSSARRGTIFINAKASISAYSRHRNPVAFWFYISLFALCGLVSLGAGIYCLVYLPAH
jgi:hypothetical protein